MDFSFVAQGGSSRPGTAEQAEQGAAPPARSNLFQIPSHREVQAAAHGSSTPNLFRPSGVTASSIRQQQQQQQQQTQVFAPAPPAVQGSVPGPAAVAAATALSTGPLWSAPRPGAPQPQPSQAVPGTYAQPGPSHVTPSYMPRPALSTLSSGPPVASTSAPHYNPNAIIASKRQQGNPLLRHIRNVRWQFGDVSPDYVLGQNTCALFISLRYHLLHPEYILHRIKEQLRAWGLIVVLCHIDIEDAVKPLGEVSKAAVMNGCTLVCAWSPEECARYLETFKSYETKPASGIQERIDPDYMSRLTAALTSIRGINRMDAQTLGTQRGTLADILRSTSEQLSACPGIGPTKVRRLLDTFQQPFRKEITVTQAQQATASPAAPGTGVTAGPATAEIQDMAVQGDEGKVPQGRQASMPSMAMVALAQPSRGRLVGDSARLGDDEMSEAEIGEDEEGEQEEQEGGFQDELLQHATQMLTQVGDTFAEDEENASPEEI